MLIFSYLWTNDQALKRLKEINAKSKEILDENFFDEY
jgi:hypothetical protein